MLCANYADKTCLLRADQKEGTKQLSRYIETSRRGIVSLTFKIICIFICFSLVEDCARNE